MLMACISMNVTSELRVISYIYLKTVRVVRRKQRQQPYYIGRRSREIVSAYFSFVYLQDSYITIGT